MNPMIMVDIETLSTQPNAVILSIGAVYISPELLVSNGFYQILERSKSQLDRHIDINTLEWWMQRENIDKYPETNTQSPFLSEALYHFNVWLERVSSANNITINSMEFWAKGTDFDFTILRNAYEGQGVKIPWAYNAIRDLRTVLKRTPKTVYTPKEDNPELHNALGDAKFQAMQLIEVLTWEMQWRDN